jgi:hypothetical protein
MLKKLFLTVLIVLLVMPVQAQESELVDYVQTAFRNLYSHGTYTIEGGQIVRMEASADETVNLDISSDFQWVLGTDDEGDIHAASGTINATVDMEMAFEAMTMNMMQQVVFYENRYYFTTSVESAGETMEEGWSLIDLNNLDQAYLDEIDVEEIDFDVIQEQMGNQFMSDYIIPVTPETVASITELDSITEEGRTLRTFDIEIDYLGLLNEDFDSVLESLAVLQGINPIEMAQTEGFIRQFAEAISASQVVYIDVQAQLPHRVVVMVTFDFGTILRAQMEEDGIEDMVMEMEITTTFSDVGAPFSVSPPKRYVELPPETIFQ